LCIILLNCANNRITKFAFASLVISTQADDSMSLLGIDLGGTKLTLALFTESGELVHKETVLLDKTGGEATGRFIREKTNNMMKIAREKADPVQSIGVSVPGISRKQSGTVWAPNIPGWQDYPLLEELRLVSDGVPVQIEGDRSCYVLGERWQGKARNCDHFIFLAIGTGIGAGIMINGQVLDGVNGSAGSIGWMTMHPSWMEEYGKHGFFECWASGEGMIRLTKSKLNDHPGYKGPLREKEASALTTRVLFEAAEQEDSLAKDIIQTCISLWGMAIANLVSLFDPAMIVLGGGVFGPAARYLPDIQQQALKWGQPQSMPKTEITLSALGSDAGVYGAGFLALSSLQPKQSGN
jgi:glucokinase